MGRHSKKSKKSRKHPSQNGGQKPISSSENIAYYFLAAVGVFVLIIVAIGLLSYFKVF